MPLAISIVKGRLRLRVHVQPRASASEITGLHGDALKVRLAAPPVDGAANESLVELLAERLALPRRNVRILSGETSRAKIVEIDGATEDAVRQLAE